MTEESTARGEQPPHSIVARVLAGLALAVCSLAIIVVISETMRTGDDAPPTERAQKRDGKRPPKDYVVAEGETATSISDKFGVPLAAMQRLNRDVDFQTLNAGEVLNLR